MSAWESVIHWLVRHLYDHRLQFTHPIIRSLWNLYVLIRASSVDRHWEPTRVSLARSANSLHLIKTPTKRPVRDAMQRNKIELGRVYE